MLARTPSIFLSLLLVGHSVRDGTQDISTSQDGADVAEATPQPLAAAQLAQPFAAPQLVAQPPQLAHGPPAAAQLVPQLAQQAQQFVTHALAAKAHPAGQTPAVLVKPLAAAQLGPQLQPAHGGQPPMPHAGALKPPAAAQLVPQLQPAHGAHPAGQTPAVLVKGQPMPGALKAHPAGQTPPVLVKAHPGEQSPAVLVQPLAAAQLGPQLAQPAHGAHPGGQSPAVLVQGQPPHAAALKAPEPAALHVAPVEHAEQEIHENTRWPLTLPESERRPDAIPWIVSQRREYKAVKVVGDLGESGMSGAVTVLDFKKNEGLSVWAGYALLKEGEEFEARLTQQGSYGNGFSVYLLDSYDQEIPPSNETSQSSGSTGGSKSSGSSSSGSPSGSSSSGSSSSGSSSASKTKHWCLLNMVHGRDIEGLRLTEKSPITHILAQMFFILKALFDRKVLHRDIKGPNMLVTPPECFKIAQSGPEELWKNWNCRFVLVDFGLACSLDKSAFEEEYSCADTGNDVYTPERKPPEKDEYIRDGWAPAADVYLMGAMLASLILGYWPGTEDRAGHLPKLLPDGKAGGQALHAPALIAPPVHNASAQAPVMALNSAWQQAFAKLAHQGPFTNAAQLINRMIMERPDNRPTAGELWSHKSLQDVRGYVENLNDRLLRAREARGTMPSIREGHDAVDT